MKSGGCLAGLKLSNTCPIGSIVIHMGWIMSLNIGDLMADTDDKMEFIERSVLELGSELYKLKQEIGLLRSSQQNMLNTLKGLRALLDDHGLVNTDDFDDAIELAEALSLDNGNFHSVEEVLSRVKKSGH